MNKEIDLTFAERKEFVKERSNYKDKIEKLEMKITEQETVLKVRHDLLKEAARYRNRLDTLDSQNEVEE